MKASVPPVRVPPSSANDDDDYDTAISGHDAETPYSTFVTRSLRLRDLNRAVHSIRSLPPALEFLVFLCGYAFNPIVIPAWAAAAGLAGASPVPFSPAAAPSIFPSSSTAAVAAPGGIAGASVAVAAAPERHPHGAFAPLFSLATVLVTLLATEVCKACFGATRPEGVLPEGFRTGPRRVRRYRSLVSSLKSRHSFPSGDCAQAANACLFLWRYVLPAACGNGNGDGEGSLRRGGRWWVAAAAAATAAFGMFLPGVCFARVFYHCHWVEDCLGGVALSAMLHAAVVPTIGRVLGDAIDEWV